MEHFEVARVSAERTFELRRSILRPHQSIDEMALKGDQDPETAHLCVFDGEVRAIGTASVRLEAPPWVAEYDRTWRLRGMATDPTWRSRGIGTALLTAVIDHVASHGGGLLWCNARLGAVGFYGRRGMIVRGEARDELSIGPHVAMARLVDGAL